MTDFDPNYLRTGRTEWSGPRGKSAFQIKLAILTKQSMGMKNDSFINFKFVLHKKVFKFIAGAVFCLPFSTIFVSKTVRCVKLISV